MRLLRGVSCCHLAAPKDLWSTVGQVSIPPYLPASTGQRYCHLLRGDGSNPWLSGSNS